MRTSFIVSAIALLSVATAASAQSFDQHRHGDRSHAAAELVQRNLEQTRQIESGLRAGQLHTREAGALQQEQARILRTQAQAMADGFIDGQERGRITAAQNALARDINQSRHDADRGFRQSPSVQRMLADVQRGLDQQLRIERGLRSGELNLREASRLEFAQAGISAREAQAAHDGFVTAQEQSGVQQARNVQSGRIAQESNDRR